MDWQTIELKGYAYYSDLGYRILVALVDNHFYDFVAEKDGTFIRVNVKTAGLKDKNQPNSWSISQASGSYTAPRNSKGEVDVYLVWFPPKQCFIEIDGDFFADGNSKSKRIPKELLE